VADALDADALRTAMRRAAPEVVMHLPTALPAGGPTKSAQAMARRLRRRQLPLPGGGPGTICWVHVRSPSRLGLRGTTADDQAGHDQAVMSRPMPRASSQIDQPM
jgi:hypothetical protein